MPIMSRLNLLNPYSGYCQQMRKAKRTLSIHKKFSSFQYFLYFLSLDVSPSAIALYIVIFFSDN